LCIYVLVLCLHTNKDIYMSLTHKSDVSLIGPIATEINN